MYIYMHIHIYIDTYIYTYIDINIYRREAVELFDMWRKTHEVIYEVYICRYIDM
jgi:hypothetical protein